MSNISVGILLRPGRQPEAIPFPRALPELQAVVGGYVQYFHFTYSSVTSEQLLAIVHEEEPNTPERHCLQMSPGVALYGNIVLCRWDGKQAVPFTDQRLVDMLLQAYLRPTL